MITEPYISRAAVLETLDDYDCVNEDALMFKAIANLPIVYLPIKTGRWLNEEYGYEQHKAECSNCYKTARFAYDEKPYSYCPNCGALMER